MLLDVTILLSMIQALWFHGKKQQHADPHNYFYAILTTINMASWQILVHENNNKMKTTVGMNEFILINIISN